MNKKGDDVETYNNFITIEERINSFTLHVRGMNNQKNSCLSFETVFSVRSIVAVTMSSRTTMATMMMTMRGQVPVLTVNRSELPLNYWWKLAHSAFISALLFIWFELFNYFCDLPIVDFLSFFMLQYFYVAIHWASMVFDCDITVL